MLTHIRRTIMLALDHDVFNTAKAAAYSGMLCFFPAVMALTALLARLPEGGSVLGEMRASLDEILPPESAVLIRDLLGTLNAHSGRVILSAGVLAGFAGLGVMLSLMEGFRRAYDISREMWGFWQKRARAFMLVPIVLLPMALASLLLVFGREIELWMIVRAGHELRHLVLVLWRLGRWTMAVATGVAVLAALYHFGTKRKEHWGRVLPGAVSATLMWFPTTLAFGWYVTRVADYSRFYGPFAAGIATLVWLYITAFSALIGAEWNGVLYRSRLNRIAEDETQDTLPVGS